MGKTLYDVLEVSQTASQDSITASYKRLSEALKTLAAQGDEDATNRLVALREAFLTLSNSDQRLRYDQSLITHQPANPPDPPRSFKPLILAGLAVLAITGSLHYSEARQRQASQEQAQREAERVESMARLAEQEAHRAQEERMALMAANQAENLRIQNEIRARQTREADIAYGNQVSQNIARAEQEARHAKAQAEQQRLNAERQRQQEAERQLERERAFLRQREWENRR